MRDDQLFDYIVESKFGKRLTAAQVEQLFQAFLALARMDPDFSQPTAIPRPRPMPHRKPAVALP
jgi:hypothetical protein